MADADRPPLRFSALLLPNVPWPQLARRAQTAEALGFDAVWIDDHARHPADPAAPWMEAWTALAGLATATTRVRIGPLVANPVLRHPALLARQAQTVAQLSGGRLEVGLGAGYAAGDHAAVGDEPWPPRERAERFEEAVALVDALLSGRPAPPGRHWRSDGAPLAPVVPRLPLAVAAHGPRALRVAARHADTWVSYGGFGLESDALLELTRARLARLERCCEQEGRDPATIGRRLLAGSAALTRAPIWRSLDAFSSFAERVRASGIDELALHFPPEGVNRPEAVSARIVERIAERWFAPPRA